MVSNEEARSCIQEIASVMREYGVARFKQGDLEVTLFPFAGNPLSEHEPTQEPLTPEKEKEAFDELLFASSGG